LILLSARRTNPVARIFFSFLPKTSPECFKRKFGKRQKKEEEEEEEEDQTEV
jgi:hypothetical protein